MLRSVPATKQNDPIRYSQLLMLPLDFGDPAHGLVEVNLVAEGELQELTLLISGGDLAQGRILLGSAYR
jgi:hypothetical protein